MNVKVMHVKDTVAPNGRSMLSEIGWGEYPIDFNTNHELVATVETEAEGLLALDEAYRLTQNIHFSWTEAQDPKITVPTERSRRSTHIGDVLILGSDAYVCAPIGWEKVLSADQKMVRG